MAYSGWLYKRALTDANSTTVTAHQVKVSLADSNFDFTHANSDGSDIRFWDATSEAELPYWIESWDATAESAVVWVKITDMAHDHEMYFGKADATSESDFGDVFVGGTDFSADYGDMTANVAANGAITRATGGAASTAAHYRYWRISESAVVTAPVGYDYCREMAPLRDRNNVMVTESDKYIAYYGVRVTATGAGAVYRCDSDDGITWANHAKVVDASPSTEYELFASHPSVIKWGTGDYRMWCTVRAGTDEAVTPNKIAYFTSSDGVSWTYQQIVLQKTAFSTPKGVQIPWVTPLANGDLAIAVEGQGTADNVFRCWGATSTDGISWTAMNSGNPIIDIGTAGAADDGGVANPKIIEVGSAYICVYNQSRSPLHWQLATATASAVGGPYTKDSASNPSATWASGTYGIETGGLCFDSSGQVVMYPQTFSGVYSTGSIRIARPLSQKCGVVVKPATTNDAAILGRVIADGTFVIDTRFFSTAEWVHTDTRMRAAVLYDAASVPSPDVTTTLDPNFRLWIQRAPLSHATNPGDLLIAYRNGSNVVNYWTGVTWSTTATWLTSSYYDGIRVIVKDDDTNFVVVLATASGSAITTASIAKSSVKAFSSGRVVIAGLPYTDLGQGEVVYDYYAVRAYAATEPSITVGEEQETTAAPTVTTTAASQITATSASTGGNVTADGGATVTERGVCYGTSENPTVDDTYVQAASGGTGAFTVNLANLVYDTLYYIRGSGLNSAGRGYATQESFRTLQQFTAAIAADGVTLTLDWRLNSRTWANITSDALKAITLTVDGSAVALDPADAVLSSQNSGTTARMTFTLASPIAAGQVVTVEAAEGVLFDDVDPDPITLYSSPVGAGTAVTNNVVAPALLLVLDLL